MLSIKLDILLFLMICRVSNCQRRIEGGARVTAPKSYVVYLLKADDQSERNYDYWLCGGAIVSNDFIITSAACVEDVKYLYVVAGYDRYVTNDNNNCIEKKKKKVIYTCVPTSYDFDFDDVQKWSRIDIALAKVDEPYDFDDESYQTICKYTPKKIRINFDPRYEVPQTDCMVMGWGHSEKWRKRKDHNNYNSDVLKYASTLVIEKESCISEFKNYPEMKNIIEKYMICTNGVGTIDDEGEPIDNSTNFDLLDGCADRRMDQQNSSCKVRDDDNLNIDFMNIRRAVPKTNRTYTPHHNYTTSDYIKDVRNKAFNRTRRNGICQNDHGGPLVTWVGTTEVLIGVASVFKIDGNYNCIGPNLHTSTQSTYDFLSCILYSENLRRSPLCDSPPSVRGFDMVENHISWKDHPAGPAENELREAKFNPHNT